MKRLFSLILTAIMLAVAVAPAAFAEDSPFIDVPESRWSYGAISYAYDRGYMDGVGGGKFSPEGTMTRAMVVTVLWRIQGSPAVEFSSEFSDVADGTWYSSAVIWAKNRGVVNGVSDTAFDPNGKITREQLVTMLFRYCDMKLYDVSVRADLSSFSDRDKIHSYALDSISWAVGAGLISGVNADTLAPRNGATREQFATILERFDKISFEKVQIMIGEKVSGSKSIDYVIRYPEGYEHGEPMPLLIFLHGSGSRGGGIDNLLGNSFFSCIDTLDDFPFIVLAPQVKSEDETWLSYYRILQDLIKEIAASRDVDETRVYMMGTSLGGEGTWYYAARMKDLIAAAVPICGSGNTGNASDYVNVPIWAHHGELDDAMPYQNSVDMVNAINEAGGNAKLTTYYNVGHGIWDQVYTNPEVYEWLLSFTKN